VLKYLLYYLLVLYDADYFHLSRTSGTAKGISFFELQAKVLDVVREEESLSKSVQKFYGRKRKSRG
jgi:hypothetical protein